MDDAGYVAAWTEGLVFGSLWKKRSRLRDCYIAVAVDAVRIAGEG